jgi:hypothetical protein
MLKLKFPSLKGGAEIMLLNYKFGDDVIYVPVALNLLARSQYFNRYESEVVDQRFVNELVVWLSEFDREGSHVLLDFQAVKNSGSRIFETLKPFFHDESPCTVICCNLYEKLFDYIITDCGNLPVLDGELSAISVKPGLQYLRSHYVNDRDFTLAIASWLNERLKKESIPRAQFLNSSNIWSNKYISIKKLFDDLPSIYLIVHTLAELTQKKFFDGKDSKADALICSSNNGAVLASAVGQILGVDVVYLMNLGPRLAPKDSHFIDYIMPDKRYVYIGDMICLGAEYRLTKTVVRARQADVVGGVVVAKHPDFQDQGLVANSKQSIFAPVTIGDDFDYQLTVKKPSGA